MKYLVYLLIASTLLVGCNSNISNDEVANISAEVNKEQNFVEEHEINNYRCYRKIDINEASIDELKKIVHINEERAMEIVDNRPFIVIDSLTLIRGIYGEKLTDIKRQDLACVERNL
ncbi:helix-hairpin-helix domain-containing protein [Bacillus sp. FJAT-45350]|uniref:helix-hairpin-helix domain-containing protein n=1 Tax=Bacillus sp. FJAT-45350 TaxID=2011014 RepID=UPI00211B7858|nr:helix-hairpin-helix domain-containing protein [Bacillus sp. FJAT-45350]